MFMQYDCYMLSAYSNSPSYFFSSCNVGMPFSVILASIQLKRPPILLESEWTRWSSFKASMHLTGTSPILSFTCFWYASRDSTIQMFLQKRSPVRNSDWSSHHCGILGGFWRIRESTPSLTKVSLLWSYLRWVGCCLTSHVQRSPTCFCSQWSCDPYSWGQKWVILLIQYATGCRFVRWEGLEVLGFGLYMKLC